MTFKDVRQMTDKELADWLEKIWRTGFTVGLLNPNGDSRKLCPNFYDKLKER